MTLPVEMSNIKETHVTCHNLFEGIRRHTVIRILSLEGHLYPQTLAWRDNLGFNLHICDSNPPQPMPNTNTEIYSSLWRSPKPEAGYVVRRCNRPNLCGPETRRTCWTCTDSSHRETHLLGPNKNKSPHITLAQRHRILRSRENCDSWKDTQRIHTPQQTPYTLLRLVWTTQYIWTKSMSKLPIRDSQASPTNLWTGRDIR